MSKKILFLLLSIALITGCYAAVRSLPAAKTEKNDVKQTVKTEEIFFFEDFDDGYKTAQREAKPMLMFFYLPNCDNSRQMMETTFGDAEIQRLAQRFVCIKINGTDELDCCKKYDVKGFPTTLLLSPQGMEIQRLSGKQTPNQLVQQMHLVIQTATARLTSIIR